jgi:GNAT superfamily N-acetyltransferase
VLFVAVADGEVIGAADCHGGTFPKDRHVGGLGIAIQEGWREVGLGRRLMERILEWMRDPEFRKPELGVFATNERARRLYESSGSSRKGSGASTSGFAASSWTKSGGGSGSDDDAGP